MPTELIKIIFIIVALPVSDFCLKWVWKAIYRSSYKTEDEVDCYIYKHRGTKPPNITGWLVDTSPSPYKTLLLITLYYLAFIPSAIATGITIFSFFIPFLNTYLKPIIIIVACIDFSSLIIGFIYKKTAKEINYLEIPKDTQTSYESQQLKDYADDYQSGKYKPKFNPKPSSIPRFAILFAMIIGFICLGIYFKNEAKNYLPVPECETVKSQIEANNITVYDNTTYNQNTYNSITESFYINIDSTHIEFYFFEDSESADDAYEKEVKIYKSNIYTPEETEIIKHNYEIYSDNTEPYFCYLIRIGNTFVDANFISSDKAQIEEILTDLGYPIK